MQEKTLPPKKLRSNRLQADDNSEDESLWIYSYADMMSLILCFFVIFYSVSNESGEASNEIIKEILETFNREESKKISSSEIGVRNQTESLRSMHLLLAVLNLDDKEDKFIHRVQELADGEKNFKAAEAILKEELNRSGLNEDLGKKVKSILAENTIDIILPFHVLFAPNSDRVSKEAENKLANLAGSLIKIKSLANIEIIGHASPLAYKYSRFQNNWALAAARAGEVARVLIKFGVEPGILNVSGLGDLRPLMPNKDREGRYIKEHLQKNSRVEIRLKKRI